MANAPTTGMAVLDIRGLRVGVVGEVESDKVELRRDGAPAVWFRPDAIFTVEDSVSLVCNRDELASYLAAGPCC